MRAARRGRASVPGRASLTGPGQRQVVATGPRTQKACALLPSDFSFGVATSGYQVEGGLHCTNWADWERQVRADGTPTIHGSDRCGPAADSWNRFDEDLRLMRWLGVDCYRFSVEWSRVEPRRGCVDDEALSRTGTGAASSAQWGFVPC